MEALAALGLACNVVQLIDFSSKVLSESREIYKSGKGSSEDVLSTKLVAEDIDALTATLQGSLRDISKQGPLNAADQALADIGQGCTETSQELQQLLQRLSAGNGSPTLIRSLRTSLRSRRLKPKRENIERQLANLQRQFNARVAVDMRHHVLEMSADQRIQLGSMDQRMKTLSEDLAAQKDCFVQRTTDLAIMHQRTLQYLSTHQALTKKEVLQAIGEVSIKQDTAASQVRVKTERSRWRAIRDTLLFPGIRERQESIEPSYRQTFEWVFQPDMAQGKDLEWHSFKDWAQGGDDLYWISGRAASGKSTFMAFLNEDDRTGKLLSLWAGATPLITASFFFWAEGTQVQRSRAGLLRALLYGCLCSKEVEHMLPFILQSAIGSASTKDDSVVPAWTETLLHAVLDRVLQEGVDKLSFCFFIDALDEFGDDDLETLLVLLKSIAKRSNVKICLSSRPWLAIQQAFEKVAQLRLEDLTERDMRIFIGDRLLTFDRFQYLQSIEQRQMESLIEAMVLQAEGVFLWIKLAVPSLLRGFGSEDEIEILQERLKYLPKGLYGMYAHMLESVEHFHLDRASRYFHLCLASPMPPSLVTLALAEKPFAGTLADEHEQHHGVEQFHDEVRRTSKRVYSHGMGLLEIAAAPLFRDPLNVRTMFAVGFGPINEQLQPLHRARVSTLHRTVRDFLLDATNETASQLLRRTDQKFHPSLQLLAAAAQQVKVCTADKHLLFRLIVDVVTYTKGIHIDDTEAMIALLDEIDKAMSTKQQTYEANEILMQVHWTNAFYLSRPYSGPPSLPSLTNRSFLDFAISTGLATYAKAKIGQLTTDELATQKQSLLYSAVKSADELFCPYLSFMDPPDPDLVDLALDLGADPNALMVDNSSAWQFWLSRVAWGPIRRESDFPRIMETFLTHGANANASLQRSSRTSSHFPLDIVDNRADALSPTLRERMTGLLTAHGGKRIFEMEAQAARSW